jgi:copper homeostasis protein
VYVLLRPRAGDFVYSDAEFSLMREDLLHARALGASGFVLGVLRADGTVDVERTRELVELAAPLEVTFHRALDLTPSLDVALEQVIATGCRRVLTSGGEKDVVAGSGGLARLVERAAGRVDIAAGGGLRLENAALVARATQARHFHGSMRRKLERAGVSGLNRSFVTEYTVDPNDIRAMIEALREGN